MFLKILQNSQENTCARVSFLIKLQAQASKFIKKETLTQVFSCELCKNPKNTFFYRTPPVATSVCCRRKVAAVKIEKLNASITKYYDINKTYSAQFHLFYSINLSFFYFFMHGFQSSILHKLKKHIKLLIETK